MCPGSPRTKWSIQNQLEGLLHRDSPLCDVGILAPAVIVAGRNYSRRIDEKRSYRITEVGNRLVRQRVGVDLVADGKVLIVQLAVLVIHPKTGANHSLSTAARRPGECYARIDIAVFRLAEAGAHSAETLRPAGGEIKGIGTVLYFVKEIEKAVARAQVQGKIRPPLELILEIAVILRLAQTVDWQVTVQSCRAYLVLIEGRKGGIGDRTSLCFPGSIECAESRLRL